MRAARLTLLILVAATLGVAGCKPKPKNITPLPGASAPEPVVTNDSPIRRRPPGNFDNGVGAGAGFKPASDNPAAVPIAADPNAVSGLPPERPGANKVEDPETLKTDTVYFDFDKSAVKPGERPKLGAVADYLKSHTDDDLVIQGHCDERGTEEYNRALGERRALALREALINLGVSGDKLTTVSYGKDRPVDPGHSEDAWSKNRRGEFLLLAPPSLK